MRIPQSGALNDEHWWLVILIRCQRGPFELIGLELRIEAEIAEHVFADQLAAFAFEDGADLEPVFLIDIDSHVGDAVFLRDRAGSPERVTKPIAGLPDLADPQV